MIKLGIMTFHNACNFGAVLQAYALKTYLNSILDVSAEIIDYRNSAVEEDYSLFRIDKNNNLLKELITNILCFSYRKKRNAEFEKFRQDYLHVGHSKIEKQELKSLNEKYDAIVVGSDQVWNLVITNGDKSFFLDFMDDKRKCISYAASIGKSSFDSSELDELRRLINNFSMVSFREQELVDLFKANIDAEKVTASVDPVYLLNNSEWNAMAGKGKATRPYVLFFTTGYNPAIQPAIEFAKKLAESKNLEVIFLSDQDKWFKNRDIEHVGGINPTEFISLISNAEYVVTNSFHATSFSIILHTKFFVETGLKRNGRILNILSLTGLSDRQLNKGAMTSTCDDNIDWISVDERLDRVRSQSKDYLADVISSRRAEK